MPYRKPAPAPTLENTPRKKRAPIEHVKRTCYRCRGTGRVPCTICGGQGRVVSGRDMYGKPVFSRCDGCVGTRTKVCPICHGERM